MQLLPESPHVDGGPEYVPIANYIAFLLSIGVLSFITVVSIALVLDGQYYSVTTLIALLIGTSTTTLYHNKMRDISYRYTLAIGTLSTMAMTLVYVIVTLTTYVFVVWLIMFVTAVSLFFGSFLFYIKLKKYENL